MITMKNLIKVTIYFCLVFFSNVHNLILLQDLNAKLEKLMAENKELNAKLENLKDENRELSQKNNGNKK